jgi:hypothetical protein
MKKILKKGISLFLGIILLALYSLPVNAAQTSADYKAALQSKYGIKITFVTDYTESEKQSLLEQIDSTFTQLGTAFVKEVVSCYTKKGYTTTIKLERLMWGNDSGSFGVNKKNATLKIMTYDRTDDSLEELGTYALAHEFGHMLHYTFDIKKGSSYVKNKWDACGTGAYVSEYAEYSYREDIAETFACIASGDYSQAGLLEAIDNDSTGVLKKKVDCMNSLLGEFTNFTTIQQMYNFQGVGTSCTNTRVSVNGKETDVYLYNIKGNNYFKLRDLAMLLIGTDKQFDVSWNAEERAIALTSGSAYTVVGGELANSTEYREKANPTTAKIYLDATEIFPTAYNIKNNNYFKLRDIAKALDFKVDWKSYTLIIDTSASYVDE